MPSNYGTDKNMELKAVIENNQNEVSLKGSVTVF